MLFLSHWPAKPVVFPPVTLSHLPSYKPQGSPVTASFPPSVGYSYSYSWGKFVWFPEQKKVSFLCLLEQCHWAQFGVPGFTAWLLA